MLAGPPNDSTEMPEALARLIDGRPYEAVWLNGIGGWTVRVDEAASSVFVKWAPCSSGDDLASEVERLRWASTRLRVPMVLGSGSNDDGSWFFSCDLNGESAVSTRWKLDPLTATTAIGRGLRALHDTLDVGSCPFEWSLAGRRRNVEQRLHEGLLVNHEFGWELEGLRIDDAMDELRATPQEDLV